MLTKKLTLKEQQEILKELFGFNLIINEDSTWLYDEDGNEFYSINENCKFDFSTLAGIFSYTAHRAKNQGYKDAQYNIQKAIGLISEK